MKSKFKVYFPCYFSYFISGAIVLMVGTILPFIKDETGINYSAAGGLLSAFAIGNLLASFVYPPVKNIIGRRAASSIMLAFIPISLIIVSMLPPLWVMTVMILFTGIGRGTVTITNNAVINDNAQEKSAALNVLHTVFAAGAFVSPFFTNAILLAGGSWRIVLYILSACAVLSAIGYSIFLDNGDKVNNEKEKGNWNFVRQPVFYVFGLLLFFYLGVENCVNGWFVTYFKSMGIMSDAYANILVSITWIMVMCGRLLTAWLSKRISRGILIMSDCILAGVFFVILITASDIMVITVAIAGLGFFFAGIYPTCIAGAGTAILGSTEGMSMLIAIAALGGIITPKIVGVVADNMSMTAAIFTLIINVIGMFIMSVIQFMMKGRKA